MADVLPIALPVEPVGEGFDALEALQNLPLVMFVADSAGNIIFSNVAAEHFFLSSSRSLKVNGLSGVFGDVTALKQHIHEVATSQSGITLHQIEIEKTPKENVLMDVKLASFASQPNGAEPLVLISIHSVGGGLQTTTDNSKNVASLADMLAHEVKNPLSGIRGAAQLLEQNANNEDKKLTEIICRECDRIRSLVESMEHFSDEQALEFDGVNIHHVLDHVLAVSKAGFASDVNIQTVYDPSLPLVRANHDALVQVLLNLVKNAAESIELAGKAGRGEIIIKTAYRHGGSTAGKPLLNPSLTLALAPIEISIHDNGTGIPETLLNSLFEPFITRKKVGKGLGLALVQKILNLHHSSIVAENTGSGAQFRLYLPLYTGDMPKTNGGNKHD